ncbi:unnamed protein product [marine sediment metagenome]|uniref:Uncharacterized protein n=1 Tax=marine sediment metagenome TaxID=412755 RepID=X1RW97_9ZZZZ
MGKTYRNYNPPETQDIRKKYTVQGYKKGFGTVRSVIEAGSDREAIARMKQRYKDITNVIIDRVMVWQDITRGRN